MGRPDSSNKDLRNTDKPNADFKKHKLYKTRFEFSNMPNSNFRAVSAKFACFIRANLAGSDFTGANLTNANFGGADLTNVNFKSAILDRANFENAKLDGVILDNASMKQCKKMKLSEKQIADLELKKNQDKERNVKRLEEKKKSPEYQQAKLELVRKKIWVQTVKDERSESGFITVDLKDGYEFLDNSDSRIKMFSDIENMLSETTKSKIKFPQQL